MKRWYQSKTMWVAILTVILGGLEATGVIDAIPESYQGAALALVGALNAVLRMVTSEAIE